jgi:hypothetical protein
MAVRTKTEMRAAVRRGIKLLDEKLPRWRRLFRIKEFDFSDPCRCVIGTIGSFQLCDDGNNWDRGKRALGISNPASRDQHPPHHYGLDWSSFDGPEARAYLTALWKKALKGERI